MIIVSEAEEQQELDSIRIVENSLATVTRERKEVFLLVCQKFAQVLSAIDSASQQWIYWWISGWYKEILRVVRISRPYNHTHNLINLIFIEL